MPRQVRSKSKFNEYNNILEYLDPFSRNRIISLYLEKCIKYRPDNMITILRISPPITSELWIKSRNNCWRLTLGMHSDSDIPAKRYSLSAPSPRKEGIEVMVQYIIQSGTLRGIKSESRAEINIDSQS